MTRFATATSTDLQESVKIYAFRIERPCKVVDGILDSIVLSN